MKLLTCFLIVGLLAAHLEAKSFGDYHFTLDGKDFDPGLLLMEGENPVEGDVACVFYSHCFRLDGPGKYDLAKDEQGRLFRVQPDGKRTLLACSVKKQEENNEGGERLRASKGVLNELAGLTAEERSGVRGVTISVWTPELYEQLRSLNLERVCVSLEREALGTYDAPAIPSLPEEIRYLMMDSGGSWDCNDFSPLKKLKKLRFLDLDRISPPAFDFEVLEGMPLEYLKLPSHTKVSHLEALSGLSSLKTLVVNHCGYLGDGKWIARLTGLRQLYAQFLNFGGDQAVALDLKPLAALRQLVGLHLAQTRVSSLPEEALPSLKQAHLLLTEAPDGVVDAFVKANPQATIRRSMNKALADELGTADRLRARTGGVCHRRESEEKTIHETREAAVIAEVAAHFQVAESSSGGHCMCCGNPTFEFYRGEVLVASLGFHHGRSIRWSDGVWPGDGMLLQSSALYLIDWLAKHGYDGPKNEYEKAMKQQEAARRRWDRAKALMPQAVATALEDAKSEEEAAAAFTKNVPDAAARAALLLSLFGRDDGTWTLTDGLDNGIQESWLPALPQDVLDRVIVASKPESEQGLGAARWLFGPGHVEKWGGRFAQIEPLARFALTHPRAANRRRCLSLLRDVGTPAVPLLEEVMRQGTKPRALAKNDAEEPGGQFTAYPGNIVMPDETPDQAIAALCLLMQGNQAHRDEALRLRATLSPESQIKWDEALRDYKPR
jgi:hypothetical protein